MCFLDSARERSLRLPAETVFDAQREIVIFRGAALIDAVLGHRIELAEQSRTKLDLGDNRIV